MGRIGQLLFHGDDMNKKMRMLLQLIGTNADASYLTKQGLEYSQISAMFGEALKNGWIEYVDNDFRVTKLGAETISKDVDCAGEGPQGNWISADERHIISQIGINDVYLPSKSDSLFL